MHKIEKICYLQDEFYSGEPLLPLVITDSLAEPGRYDSYQALAERRSSAITRILRCYSKLQDLHPPVPDSASGIVRKSDFKEVTILKSLLRKFWCPMPRSCRQLLAEENETDKYISTGYTCLDEVLGGGIRTSELIEFIGNSGVGKTQLCLSLCAALLVNDTKACILYMDTNGNFDATQLLRRILDHTDSSNEQIPDYLNRIRRYSCPTIQQLTEMCLRLRLILCQLNQQSQDHGNSTGLVSTDNFYASIKLVIVDSLVMSFLPFTGLLPHIVRPKFVVVNTELMRIARTKHCAVIVVSHKRSFDGFRDAKYQNYSVSQVTKQEYVKHLPTTLSTNAHKQLLFTPVSYPNSLATDGHQKVEVSLIQNSGNPGMCRSVSEKHECCILSF